MGAIYPCGTTADKVVIYEVATNVTIASIFLEFAYSKSLVVLDCMTKILPLTLIHEKRNLHGIFRKQQFHF